MAAHVFRCALWYALGFLLLLLPSSATDAPPRYIMYLTGQHPIVPEPALVSSLTHVALAFMRPLVFNDPNPTSWPIYGTVKEMRPKFAAGTKMMVAIGGWGDTAGFEDGAKTEASRALFAKNVAKMVAEMGADGVDIDWEYPGGNGEDYKQVPNSEKAWQIEAYPKLLSEIRKALGPFKIISAAVPGLPRDMLAFTNATLPLIMQSVDFLNVMTYDLMNRRDNVTKHHTGLQISLESIDAYLDKGVLADRVNLGLAFYVKWFLTDPKERENCKRHPIGCKTQLMEDPLTGADLGKAGAFSWHDMVPSDLNASFTRALEGGKYDKVGGGHYFFDAAEDRFWTWDDPQAILRKFPMAIEERGLGGVFAWGLGEDGTKWLHLKASNRGVAQLLAAEKKPGGHAQDFIDRSEL